MTLRRQMPNQPTQIERKNDRERWWEIHERGDYICPDCGRIQSEHERRWEVHHINGVAGNCVALCEPCHHIRHGAEPKNVDLDWWKRDFVSLGEGL